MNYLTFIALHATCGPVRRQCQLLGIRPSGYCAWRKRAPTPMVELTPAAWQLAAPPGTTQRVFITHAGRYGQRRLRAQLRREGHVVGRQRLRGWLSTTD